MKRKEIVTIVVMTIGLMFWYVEVSAEPMGTAWTYQGRLMDDNGPSDGLYDFQFKLYDNANVIDGNQIGSDVNVPDVDVIAGYFTVVLEFGSDVFNGDARWLEIEVRHADSNDPNDFITLIPRQEVTPTPYALQTRGIFVDGAGNVGIGTNIPFERLDVDHGNLLVQGIGSFDTDGEEAFVYLGDNHHYIKSGWGFGVSIGTWEVDPAVVVRETTGRVGIGTIDQQKSLSIQATRPQIALVENGGDAGVLEFHEQENQLRLQYWTNYGSAWDTTMMTLDGDTGNVGIGTIDPGSRLDIKAASGYSNGGLRITSSINDNQVITLQDVTPGDQGRITVKGGGTNKIILSANGDTYFNGGNVGIGTPSPGSRLDIKAASGHSDGGLRVTSSINNNPVINLQDATPGDQGQVSVRAGGSDKIVLRANGDTYFNGGRVGIGTTNPFALLSVESSGPYNYPALDVRATGPVNPLAAFSVDNPSGNHALRIHSASEFFPAVRIMNEAGGGALEVHGNASVDVLQITGADVAEKFPVSEDVKPGIVVAIDPENPGKLCLARGAYNRCVAGVVSGAGDLPTGAILGNIPGQEDAMPIALSGRVWVYCDANEQPIEPGNLLTTSKRPGYAMAVSDYTKAHGAVLGKAMTSLEKGQTGLVLTLINLQ